MEIRKMSLLDALTRFRNDIVNLRLSPAERIKYLEEFKQQFKQSLDYFEASEAILDKIVPNVSMGKNEKSEFKEFWGEMNKDIPSTTLSFSDLSSREFSEVKSQIQNLILNEGRDLDEIADEFSNEYGFEWSEVKRLAKQINDPEIKTEKGIVDTLTDFFGPGPAGRLRAVIEQDFRNGLDETTVINSLVLDASQHYDKPMTAREVDIIRMYVINEKVRLRRDGLLKNI